MISPLATPSANGIEDNSPLPLSAVTEQTSSGSDVLMFSAKGDVGLEVANSTCAVPAINGAPALVTPASRTNPITPSSFRSLQNERSSASPQPASSSLFHSPISTNRFSVHENVIRAGHKVVGQGARVGEALFGRTRGYLATKKKLKKIRQHAKAHSEKSKEIASRLCEGESVTDEAVLKQELEQLRR